MRQLVDFPAVVVALKECRECSCQGRKLHKGSEGSDMCGSNGSAIGSTGVRKFVMSTAQTFSTSQCLMS